MSERNEGRNQGWLFLLGGFMAVLLLAVGLLTGWLVASRNSSAPPQGAFTLPPSATIGVPLITPRPTFTAAPILPTDAGTVPLVEETATANIIPPEAGDNYVTFRVRRDLIDVYQGPGTEYQVLGAVTRDTVLLVAGRTMAGDWWLVCCVNEQSGWVALEGDNLVVEGDVSKVDVLGSTEP